MESSNTDDGGGVGRTDSGEFNFEPAADGKTFAAQGGFCCPYAVPARVCPGKDKKPWRKRHPVIFWFLLLLLLYLMGNLLYGFFTRLEGRGFFSGPRLGLIRVEGMIFDSERVVRWTDRLRRDPSVKGVLVRIDSPGGAVVPAQEIHAAVRRLAGEKPVIVSMGTVAASGGYYVAVAGEYIIASPSTLTANIGVRMSTTDMHKVLETIGVKMEGLASGPYKESGTPYRPMRDDERVYLQSLMNDMHEAFVEEVAKGRKLTPDEVRWLSDGKAYTGRQALQLGLVDELGDMDMALKELARRCQMEKAPEQLLDGPEPDESFWLHLLGLVLMSAKKTVWGGETLPYKFYY